MWKLDYQESWAPKKWCFWTVVLEKTLESPLDDKEIQPVHSNGISPECSLEGLMVKLKLQYFGHLMQRADSLEKTLMLGKIEGRRRRGGQEEKGMTEDEMVGWHHWLNGHGFGYTLGVGDGQGDLECCGPWGYKESDTTEWLNWTEVDSLNNRHIFLTVLEARSPRMSSTVSVRVLSLPYRSHHLAVPIHGLSQCRHMEGEIDLSLPHFLGHQSYQVSIRLHLSLIASKSPVPNHLRSLGFNMWTCQVYRQDSSVHSSGYGFWGTLVNCFLIIVPV